MNEAPTPRPAARIILIDAQDRVFLMYFSARADGTGIWITPGGGLDPGETHEEAALRELYEEVGLRGVDLGPCVWFRSFVYPFGGRMWEQQERFFVCRVESHDIGDHVNHDEMEREVITELRWWSLAELEASPERFAPSGFARLLGAIVSGDYPAEPFDVGV